MYAINKEIGNNEFIEIISEEDDNDHTYAEDTFFSNQLDQAIGDNPFSIPVTVGLEVTKIADMSFLIARTTVLPAKWVEGRAGRGTAVGIVSVLVNLHASLGGGVAPGNIIGDSSRRGSGGLLERHSASDVGVTPENCHYDPLC